MSPTPESPVHPPRSFSVPKKVSRRVKYVDRAADLLIRAGGVGIILIVGLIFVFIALEAFPLFRPASQEPVFNDPAPAGSPAPRLALGLDEYESFFYYVDPSAGVLRFVSMDDRARQLAFPLAEAGLPAPAITAAYRTPSHDKVIVGTADGHLLIAEAKFRVDYGAESSTRTVTPGINVVAHLTAFNDGRAVSRVHLRQNSNGDYFYAAADASGHIVTGKLVDGEPAENPAPAGGGRFNGRLTAMILDYEGNRLFVATDAGKLYQWYLDDNRETPFRVYDLASYVTDMDYMIGDTALVLGFADGRVESWFGVREKPTDVLKPIHRIHSFESMPAAVTCVRPSARDKGFFAGSKDGTIRLFFTTSERTMLTFKHQAPVNELAYSPKLTGVLAASNSGSLEFRSVSNPHPEISFKSLFGKVHYEGYDEPDYIWQSTGGTDDFEAKFSLVPLIIGTLKGSFYGLLFAIPIAIIAALYTSQFMNPGLRTYLKPTVEIMAALPSVVIGFLAGLWLAPLLEQAMVGTLLSGVVIPLLIVAGACGWNLLPRNVRRRVPYGTELVLIFPLVIGGFYLAQAIGPVVESLCFHGNYKQWVFDTLGRQFEQRNSIVIGIAMGFAVIPIIFTISEDAFSNVPASFKSASYALGASRWQTAYRIILPTASPGVFSAVMIGFGRAVGETMIVLMATGNTPIMSFSPFNGMRTMAANIAVEIPEAPNGGTLYRVLFVAALLLFALTFVVNTAAEIVRQRLRTKYQAV